MPTSIAAPDVSIAPPKIPYGGFSPVRFQGRYIRRAFLSITSSSHRAVCLRPSCISLPVSSYPRAESRDELRSCTTVQTATAALPQGPSLRSGLCCPGPSSLNWSHAPHSQAQPDFAARRLIRAVLAVRHRATPRRPRSGSVLLLAYFLDMSSSETTGSPSVAFTQFLRR
jgi:hypothetical protein